MYILFKTIKLFQIIHYTFQINFWWIPKVLPALELFVASANSTAFNLYI